MKTNLLVIAVALFSTSTFAEVSCDQKIDSFLESIAPTSKEVTVKGHYTKKSKKTGKYEACELTIKKLAGQFSPEWTPEKLDPSNGDGGGLWPFNSYPTISPKSDEFHKVKSYSCEASEEGFSVSYTYKNTNEFFKRISSALSAVKNDDGSYDVTLLTSKNTAVVCRGELLGK